MKVTYSEQHTPKEEYMRTLFGALLALLIATPAFAQSPQAVDNDITLELQDYLSLAATQSMDFGSHFSNETTADNVTPAIWTGAVDPGATIDVSMSLPVALLNGGSAVPFICGPGAGYLNHDEGPIGAGFDPAVGLAGAAVKPDGTFVITLGKDTNPTTSDMCTVDLSDPGIVAGSFSGTATLTVTVN